MIFKVEISERKREREKETDAIEIEREIERKVRLGVKCKPVTDT